MFNKTRGLILATIVLALVSAPILCSTTSPSSMGITTAACRTQGAEDIIFWHIFPEKAARGNECPIPGGGCQVIVYGDGRVVAEN